MFHVQIRSVLRDPTASHLADMEALPRVSDLISTFDFNSESPLPLPARSQQHALVDKNHKIFSLHCTAKVHYSSQVSNKKSGPSRLQSDLRG